MGNQTRYDPLEDLTEEEMERRQKADTARAQGLRPSCPFRRHQRGYSLWISWAKGVTTGRQMGTEPLPTTVAEFRKGQGLSKEPYAPRIHRLMVPRKETYHE